MEIVELILEVAPLALSALATIVAFVKGKTKTTLSADDKKAKLASIKEKADKKYNCYVDKQLKKNNIDIGIVEKSLEFDETEV